MTHALSTVQFPRFYASSALEELDFQKRPSSDLIWRGTKLGSFAT